jgi:adenine-specific DNA-methyltransferase
MPQDLDPIVRRDRTTGATAAARPKHRSNQPSLPFASSAGLAEGLMLTARGATIEIAQVLAHAVTEGWWDAVCEALGAPSPLQLGQWSQGVVALSDQLRAEARLIGAALKTLPVEEALAQIGLIYSHSLSDGHRSANGIFYTPPALVHRLVQTATEAGVDWQRDKVISPSCGGGAFLVEDVRLMIAAMEGSDPALVLRSVGARLRGWDCDPFACWLSQVAVEAVLLPRVIASGKRLPVVTECRNSLMDDWKGHIGVYGLVNENPAFGKMTKTEGLTARFARSQKGHLNTYGLFADLSIHLAKPQGGVIALLTPTSYFGGEYFAKLRRLFHTEARPTGIDLVASREDVFPDVLQEVALSVFVRGQTKKRVPCSVIHVELDSLRIEKVGELALPAVAEGPWIIARSPAAVPVVEAMHAMRSRLKDWGYRVKTGPLVPHKNEVRMHRANAPGLVPVVWAECVTTDGRFTLRCERGTRSPFYEPKSSLDANLVTQPCLLLQRTTAKEQHRRLIGAVMPASAIKAAGGRVSVENHLNMLIPVVRKPPVALNQLAAFFASNAADKAFRCISGSVAVSATELEAMPLPQVDDLLFALAADDSEAALNCLYGMREDGEKASKHGQG